MPSTAEELAALERETANRQWPLTEAAVGDDTGQNQFVRASLHKLAVLDRIDGQIRERERVAMSRKRPMPPATAATPSAPEPLPMAPVRRIATPAPLAPVGGAAAASSAAAGRPAVGTTTMMSTEDLSIGLGSWADPVVRDDLRVVEIVRPEGSVLSIVAAPARSLLGETALHRTLRTVSRSARVMWSGLATNLIAGMQTKTELMTWVNKIVTQQAGDDSAKKLVMSIADELKTAGVTSDPVGVASDLMCRLLSVYILTNPACVDSVAARLSSLSAPPADSRGDE